MLESVPGCLVCREETLNAQFVGVYRLSTLAENLANLLAIAEPIMCHKVHLLDAAALPWTPA